MNIYIYIWTKVHVFSLIDDKINKGKLIEFKRVKKNKKKMIF